MWKLLFLCLTIELLYEVNSMRSTAIGHQNHGHQNRDYHNYGHYYLGYRNHGHRNHGRRNHGHRNHGHRNSIRYNNGYHNRGHYNRDYYIPDYRNHVYLERDSNTFSIPSADEIEKNVIFHLYTRSNPTNPHVLQIGDLQNLKASPFSNKRKTKILIHGWRYNSLYDTFAERACKNYLQVGDYNVILVYWTELSHTEYSDAVKLTRLIATQVRKLLEFFHTSVQLLYKNVHIMGHSLGAHIAGYIGGDLSGSIGRITGLDPAAPSFEYPSLKSPQHRLDKNDAVFVDVIHTCKGIIGFTQPIGDVDFYPNGGDCSQPGCNQLIPEFCGHFKSVSYMLNSIIHPEQYRAPLCSSWKNFNQGKCSENSHTVMGEHVDMNARGVFYLKTECNCQSRKTPSFEE